MKNWFDLEPLLDKIETLDKATLEEFSIIQPPPSQNSAFHHIFINAKERIIRRLNQIEADEALAKVPNPNPTPQPPAEKPNHIHNIGVGVLIVVLGAAAIWSIAYYFNVHL